MIKMKLKGFEYISKTSAKKTKSLFLRSSRGTKTNTKTITPKTKRIQRTTYNYYFIFKSFKMENNQWNDLKTLGYTGHIKGLKQADFIGKSKNYFI